jgi:hypothetical protein
MIYHASLLLNHGWRGYEGEGPNSQQAGIDLLAPTTRNPLPVTRYPLPVTRYPLPVTRYPLPVTRYPLPVTRYPLPVTRYPLLLLHPPQIRSHIRPHLQRIVSNVFQKND